MASTTRLLWHFMLMKKSLFYNLLLTPPCACSCCFFFCFSLMILDSLSSFCAQRLQTSPVTPAPTCPPTRFIASSSSKSSKGSKGSKSPKSGSSSSSASCKTPNPTAAPVRYLPVPRNDSYAALPRINGSELTHVLRLVLFLESADSVSYMPADHEPDTW